MSFLSVLGKIAKVAAPAAAMFIPGVGPAVGGALGGVLGKVGQGLSSPLGQLGVQTGLGVLGNVLSTNAYNQPEKWRQGIIENELQRRNALQATAAPTLAGLLGYRTPQMGQQLAARLGSRTGSL